MVSSGNYLRALRRRWHLTQEELAFIFGYTDHSIISHLERQERSVTFAVAHTCHVLFGCGPSDVFPALYQQVETNLAARIRTMLERLELAKQTTGTKAKLQLLQEVSKRLDAVPLQRDV